MEKIQEANNKGYSEGFEYAFEYMKVCNKYKRQDLIAKFEKILDGIKKKEHDDNCECRLSGPGDILDCDCCYNKINETLEKAKKQLTKLKDTTTK